MSPASFRRTVRFASNTSPLLNIKRRGKRISYKCNIEWIDSRNMTCRITSLNVRVSGVCRMIGRRELKGLMCDFSQMWLKCLKTLFVYLKTSNAHLNIKNLWCLKNCTPCIYKLNISQFRLDKKGKRSKEREEENCIILCSRKNKSAIG